MVFVVTGCGKDETAPVFQNVTDGKLLEITVPVKTTVNLKEGVVAIDDVDGEVQVAVNAGNFDANKVGTYTITYTATDAAGNVATVTRVIKVVDTASPLFKHAPNGVLPAHEVLQYTSFDPINDYEYLDVKDNVDTDLKATVKNDGGFDINKAGTYTITYAVKDSSNNETTATLAVTVIEGIKIVNDVLRLKGTDLVVPVAQNVPDVMAYNENGALIARDREPLNMLSKEEFIKQWKANESSYSKNGGVPYLPWGTVAIVDADLKPVLIRNATYALEAQRNADGTISVLKNGTDDNDKPVKLTFIDESESAKGAGIFGHTEDTPEFISYIPDGGWVLIAGTPSDGSDGKVNAAKNFLINSLMDRNYSKGALSWPPKEFQARVTELMKSAQFEFVKDYTMVYPRAAKYVAPEIKIESNVLSWEAVADCFEYEIYINGELVKTTANTTHKMVDFGLEPSVGEETYKIKVIAKTYDIIKHEDSDPSNELSYAMPQLTQLVMGELTLEGKTLSWDAVEGATKYVVYARQCQEVGFSFIELGQVTTTSFDLSTASALNSFVYNCELTVVALGDGNTILDSERSAAAFYQCSSAQVIKFSDGRSYPVIVTTAADYFARRNTAGETGYASTGYLYLITDAHNITENHKEAYSFLVALDKNQQPKTMLNILAGSGKEIYINGEWKDAAAVEYTSNADQYMKKYCNLVEGDMVLIGKNGCKPFDAGLSYQLDARSLVSHYYWGKFTEETTVGKTDPWRSAHTISTYPTFEIKNENELQLNKPALSCEGSTVSWGAVKGAESYSVRLTSAVNYTTPVEFKTTELSFDVLNYVKVIGRSGSYGWNYEDLTIEVVATAEGRDSSDAAVLNKRLTSVLTDGTNSVNVTYNLLNSLWNGGSGAICRTNDKTSTLMTGAAYKASCEENKSGHMGNNAGVPFSANGIVVVLDKDLKVKSVRFGHATVLELDANGNQVTEGIVWTNSNDKTNGGGNLLGIDTLVADNDYVLIGTNVGNKAQLKAITALFLNTDSETVIGSKVLPTDSSVASTKVDYTKVTYSWKCTLVDIPAE